jgi:hypothetical protein
MAPPPFTAPHQTLAVSQSAGIVKIVFSAVAAGLGLFVLGLQVGVSYSKDVYLSTKDGKLGYQVEELSKQKGELQSALEKERSDRAAEKAAADQKNAGLQLELKNSRAATREAQLSNLFQFGLPYPSGVAKVKVGDLSAAVDAAYTSTSIDKSEGTFWSVKLDHEVFSSVIYYSDKGGKNGQSVYQILFMSRPEALPTDNYLQEKLVDLLGPPTKQTLKGAKYWDLPNRLRVESTRPRYFTLSTQDYLTRAEWK